MTRQAVWQVLLSPHDAFGYVQHDDDYSFLLTTRHDRTIGATTEHGRYNLDGQNILLEMYHLATIFYASKPLSELTNLDPKFKDPIGDMMELCETTEAYRALLNVAIRIRIVLDWYQTHAAYYLKKAAVPVGTITWTTTKKREDLSLREACNKIIHARSADFHYESSHEHRRSALLPEVTLVGVRDSKEWRATLQISEFLYHGFFLANYMR